MQGGGKMAESLIARVVTDHEILVYDNNAKRCGYLGSQYQVESHVKLNDEAKEEFSKSDVIVLSVKPQNTSDVFQMYGSLVSETSLVLSVVAGLTLEEIITGMKTSNAIRAMPNTPAIVQQGMSVWTASKSVSSTHKKLAQDLLSSCGKEVYVHDEDLIDMATAVSGSGPAYVFMIMESMVEAAVHMVIVNDIHESS